MQDTRTNGTQSSYAEQARASMEAQTASLRAMLDQEEAHVKALTEQVRDGEHRMRGLRDAIGCLTGERAVPTRRPPKPKTTSRGSGSYASPEARARVFQALQEEREPVTMFTIRDRLEARYGKKGTSLAVVRAAVHMLRVDQQVVRDCGVDPTVPQRRLYAVMPEHAGRTGTGGDA